MKKEILFFYFCIALNALPILLFRFFPSMDGPAHLYNANVLSQLCRDQSEVLHHYYTINPALVPNWTSHVLLAGFKVFLPAFLAEKVLLLLYVVGLPLTFRKFISCIAPSQSALTYIIFPFIYNYLFCLGFYNLSLSIILLFAGLTIAIRQIQAPSLRGWMGQAILFLLTYFTHPFSFALLVLGSFAIWAAQCLFSPVPPSTSLFQRFLSARPNLVRLGFACFIPVLLLLHFYATQHFYNSGQRLSTGEIMRYLKDLRPLICYNYNLELRLTEHLYHLFAGLTAIAFYERINGVISGQYSKMERFKRFFQPNDVWLSLALLLLVLLFVVPNSASAGMMSDRFALFFFLFWATWLAVQPLRPWLLRTATIIILVLNFGLTYRYIRVAKDQNKIVAQCVAASQYIPAGSTVLPLNYANNWLVPHFSNYLGIEKPMLILENYEADTGWFPLLWRTARPSPIFGDDIAPACLPGFTGPLGTAIPVDYVFLLGKLNQTDSCQVRIKEILDHDYESVYHSDNAAVFLYRHKHAL